MSIPLITCLCITRNRREWLPKAIACFQRQSYPNRELLIVSDGDSVYDLVPDDPCIRAVALDEVLSIGSKRNFGCELAHGEIIAHWDDDDWSAPNRLADQVSRLIYMDRQVDGYTQMAFTDGREWWRYRDEHYVFGTSLCYRRAWWQQHPFPAIPCGEDNAFVEMARNADVLTYVPAERQMYATVHPRNTSAKSVHSAQYEPLPGFAWPEAA